jgi:hypothetical protein
MPARDAEFNRCPQAAGVRARLNGRDDRARDIPISRAATGCSRHHQRT